MSKFMRQREPVAALMFAHTLIDIASQQNYPLVWPRPPVVASQLIVVCDTAVELVPSFRDPLFDDFEKGKEWLYDTEGPPQCRRDFFDFLLLSRRNFETVRVSHFFPSPC